MVTDRFERVRAVVEAIAGMLRTAAAEPGDTALAAQRTLDRLQTTALSRDAFTDRPPRSADRHQPLLTQAVDQMQSPLLLPLQRALRAAIDDLVWAEDQMKYYAADADVGLGYRNGNLHTLLIGPGACGFEHADFTLGFFLLHPHTLYRDHAHPAPETYLNLSSRSGWRFGQSGWRDLGPGSLVYNPSMAPHATRSYEQPFFSVFSWLEDIAQPCVVLPRDDWTEIEADLEAMKGHGITG